MSRRRHVFNDLTNALIVESSPDDDTVYRVIRRSDHSVLCEIPMQTGPVEIAGINGVSLESLLAIAINRLQELNKPPHQHVMNRQALNHLSSALLMLESRTIDRQTRNVEGTLES